MAKADAAAERALAKVRTDPDPEAALEAVLAFHVQQFELQVARDKFGSNQKANESARAILNVAKELLPFRKPKLAAVATQNIESVPTVIRAPMVEPSTEAWVAKYGAKREEPKALEPPPAEIFNQIRQQADVAILSGMEVPEQYPDQPPMRSDAAGVAPPSEIPPEFQAWALRDRKRRN